ncbi:MAG TPA: thiamine pyrophosphate-binding protein, partial [Candidatus Methylomirabilis sp.]|nr:thiamine pyrophosphate-binding protein [Candidatus Methylomirabilis sp.]
NVHVSPGLGNAMGMLYDAYKAGTPLLLTAGQHDQSFTLTEPILWSELPPVAKPYVKWAYEVRRLADLPLAVHRAAKVALSPPTGPVFLSLPMDLLTGEAEFDLRAPTRVDPRVRGPRAAVAAAAERLGGARRPLIIAGSAVAKSDAHAELMEVARLLAAPVYTERLAYTCNFPSSHPLFQGEIPRSVSEIRALLGQYDLLFCVGGNLFLLSLPSEVDPMPPGLPVIHLDPDPWEIGKNYPAEVGIVGDPKATLMDLAQALRKSLTLAYREAARQRLALAREAKERAVSEIRARAREMHDRMPIPPLALLETLAEQLPPTTILVDESLSSGSGLHHLFKCEDPKSFFGLHGGGIGWGLPGALGVKLALPDRPVVALIGDGGTMYTNQALWTAAHYHLGVVVVVINNAGYRILKQRTHALKGISAQTGRYVGMDLEQPRIDFVGLAQALGVPAERVEKAAEIGPALAQAIARGGPSLIDVTVDGSFLPREKRR